MTPDVVVDIGNTRVKWGRCRGGEIVETVSISHTVLSWFSQARKWADLPHPATWVISGVVPDSMGLFSGWLDHRGDRYEVVNSPAQVPIQVDVDQPNAVGIDRLLAAVAAQRLLPEKRLLVVTSGSAITMNLVDDAFRGGAILPGRKLLSRSLRDYTAKLPYISLVNPVPFPGRNTAAAIRSGLCSVIGGAIERVAHAVSPDTIVITGGDGRLVEQLIGGPWPRRFEPLLTLWGLLLAAQSFPAPRD